MAEGSNKKRPSGGTSKKKTASGKKAAEAETLKRKREERRRTRVFVFFILTLFALIGCFTSEGWFIWFFREFVQGLIGKGFYVLPAALLGCALLPALRRKGIKSRTVCLLLLPVLLGAIIHLFSCTADFRWSWSLPGELYRAGTAEGAAGSGGLIGGLLAMSCRGLFNMLGATAVLLLVFAFLLLGAFNVNFATIAEWYRSRPEKIRDDDEEEYEEPSDRGPVFPVRAAKTPPERAAETRVREEPVRQTRPPARRTVIDIPIDDDPPRLKKTRRGAAAPTEPSSGMIADVLAGSVPPPTPIGRTEVGRFAADAAESGVRERPAAETRPESAQVSAAEVAKSREEDRAAKAAEELEKKKAAAEVADSIEKNLAEPEEVKYVYPPMDLLTKGSAVNAADGQEEMSVNARRLSATIKSFGIAAEICGVTRGPTVTRYEVELEQGVKLNKLTNLADDIALALGATGVRIAPIPGKISIVGIEVPNKMTNTVFLRDVIDTPAFKGKESRLTFAIGKDIGGTPIVGDIASLPHMLIAGTTGSGKSVCMNSLILSLLYKSRPDEVRLIMVDPKMVELGIYNGIPHLLIPVVTDPKKAAGALQWSVMEMLKRNRLCADVGARDLASYNKLMEKTEGGQKLPQIVVLIDELADLMLVAAKEVEESICRIAAMGRAAGIHLVIATQRPSADVITGLMKANIPSRIAFAVDSSLNSRIILDAVGAEKLVGKGDMLYSPVGIGKPMRVQGTFVTDAERESVVNFVKEQGLANYSSEVQDEIERSIDKDSRKEEQSEIPEDKTDGDTDELFSAAVEVILESGQASVSMLQRRLKLGYSRAARLVDQMEDRGIVGPFEGSKPRALLITREQWNEMQGAGPAPEAAFGDGGPEQEEEQ